MQVVTPTTGEVLLRLLANRSYTRRELELASRLPTIEVVTGLAALVAEGSITFEILTNGVTIYTLAPTNLPAGFVACDPCPVSFRVKDQMIDGVCLALNGTGKLWLSYEWNDIQQWCEVNAMDCWIGKEEDWANKNPAV